MPVTYATVKPTKRIALWPQHLFRGTVTVLAGPGGKGKGLIGIHAAACTVRGSAFPGQYDYVDGERQPASVIGVWPEDDPNEDIAWRLRGCLDGAGLTRSERARVIDMTEYKPGCPFDLRSEEALGALRAEIARKEATPYPVRLVVIDPLMAVADRLTTNAGARSALAGLMSLARETGVAVLLVHHTIKDGKTVAGSKAILDVARLVFRIEEVPGNPGVIFLVKEKGNNVGDVPKLAYGIAGSEEQPWLLWAGHNSTQPQPGRQARGTVPWWQQQAG